LETRLAVYYYVCSVCRQPGTGDAGRQAGRLRQTWQPCTQPPRVP